MAGTQLTLNTTNTIIWLLEKINSVRTELKKQTTYWGSQDWWMSTGVWWTFSLGCGGEGRGRSVPRKDSQRLSQLLFWVTYSLFSTEWFEVLSDKDPCHAGRVWNNALPDNENPGWFSPTYTVQTVERLRVISALIVCAIFFFKF